MTNIAFPLVLILMVWTCNLEAKTKNNNLKWMQDVDNMKSFKKLLRTKINVLVMFAENGNAAEKKFDVFGEAAAKSKGTATLAWIDCSSKEGKKVCKKQKANPPPVVFQHYKDGEYSADYDRKFSVKSILAFLKDPKSDGPWDEEDNAKDVIHIESQKQLNKFIKKSKPMLVMFYAPWCGYCKRFKPVFAEVASELKGQVLMAGVDAENNKDAQALRETYNVTGFPKTIYFDNGKELFEYSSGHTKQELIDWLNDPQEPKPKEPELEWSDTENDVIHLTDDTFDQFIEDNSKVMVFFYAPWCGHCKNLKPEWEKAATVLKDEEASEKLAAMDATKYKQFADRYKVTGYPTVIYFEDGAEKYNAGSAFKRTAEGIIEYIKDPKEPPPPEKPWNEVESDVMHLEDSNFKQSVKKKKHALVMFYAPWCGHCKKAKPEYQNAASKFVDDKKVAFTAVDCTTNREVCNTFDVKGYPTFYYVSYGKNPTPYEGGREERDFVEFMLEHVKEKTKKKEDFWGAIPHSGLLYQLTNKTWSNFVERHDKVLVTIYNEDCPNCREVRKHLAECAKAVFEKKINVQLAVLDSEKYANNIHRLWTVDMGVPTLFWYKKGIKRFEYTNSRNSADLLRFIQNPVKPETKKTYGDWSMEESADSIYHYNDDGFDEFARDQENMMVFFYSPTCRTCFQLRHMYENAANILDEVRPSVAMVAVNLAEAIKTKHKYSISVYPHFAYFRNGKYKYQYHGKQESKSIVKFMKKPKYIPKPFSKTADHDEKKGSNVTSLNKETFEHFINTHDHVMVMFFTKWCGHCKIFKPKYEEAADKLKELKSKAQLAAIEGGEGKTFAKKYKVYGFPTMIYLKQGEFESTYSAGRTVDNVVKYMRRAAGEEKSRMEEKTDEIAAGKPPLVKSLSPSNITRFLSKNEETFVMFYAPGCGACKTAKQGFYKASVEATDELGDEIGFAIFNAFEYRNDVRDYDIRGYPTFWYFVGKEKKFKYYGQYTKKAFLNFFENPKEIEEAKSRDSPTQWISETSHVEHPNIKNIDKFLQKYKKTMLFFYISACEVCLVKIKPEYTKAAQTLHDENQKSSKLAAINGGWEKELMKRFHVDSFPSFVFFEDGNFKYKYHGSWRAVDIVKFMKNPREDLAKKVKPTSWQDMTPPDFGHVVHLGNATYDKFVKNHSSMHKWGLAPTLMCECGALDQTAAHLFLEYPYIVPPEDIMVCWSWIVRIDSGLATLALTSEEDLLSNLFATCKQSSRSKAVVMFHSLYYERCKKARQRFKTLSTELDDEFGFGAVDCHRKPEQGLVCYHLSIRKFPSYKFYESGKFEADVIDEKSDDLTKFLFTNIEETDELKHKEEL